MKQPQGNRGGSEKADLVDGFPSSVVFLVCPPKLGKPPKLLAMGNGEGQGQVGYEWDTLDTCVSPVKYQPTFFCLNPTGAAQALAWRMDQLKESL